MKPIVNDGSHNNRYATQLISTEGGINIKNKPCGELYQL